MIPSTRELDLLSSAPAQMGASGVDVPSEALAASASRTSSGGRHLQQARAASQHRPHNINGAPDAQEAQAASPALHQSGQNTPPPADFSFFPPAANIFDRGVATAAPSEGFTAGSPFAAASLTNHPRPPAPQAYTPFAAPTAGSHLAGVSSREPTRPPSRAGSVGPEERGVHPAANRLARVSSRGATRPASRAGSGGLEGRDPHPTALKVVQEIKRMRSRAASAAEAMGPDSETAKADGQPCAPAEVAPSAAHQVQSSFGRAHQ